ncbi:MAG: hypothetical protein NVS2B16_00910 [Chloroflexota bacterium]
MSKRKLKAGTIIAPDGNDGWALGWVFWDDNDPVNRLSPEYLKQHACINISPAFTDLDEALTYVRESVLQQARPGRTREKIPDAHMQLSSALLQPGINESFHDAFSTFVRGAEALGLQPEGMIKALLAVVEREQHAA